MNKKEIMDLIMKNERPITEERIDQDEKKYGSLNRGKNSLEEYIIYLLSKENQYRLRGEVFGLLNLYMRRLKDPNDDLRKFPMLDNNFRKHLVTTIIHGDKNHKITVGEIEYYDVDKQIDVRLSLAVFRLISQYNTENNDNLIKLGVL